MPQVSSWQQEEIVYSGPNLVAALGLPVGTIIVSVVYDFIAAQMTIIVQGPTTVNGTP